MKRGQIGIWVLALTACSSGPDVPAEPEASAKNDIIAFYRSFLSTVAACDAAGSQVAAVGQANDLVALYRAADNMEAACLSTPSEIRKLEIPASVGKIAYDRLTKARDDCDMAYVNKWAAAGAMKEALEDTTSIAAQAELSKAGEQLSAGTMLCSGGLVGTATSMGATSKDLGLES